VNESVERPVRVLIVDDEPAARRGVVQLLDQYDEFEIVGECSTGEEMVSGVERHDPELVFLDVQMPGLDGFGALARLPPETDPLVIFITGYDRYAVRAFEAHAIDYLLKPYSPERFRRACDHAVQQLRRRRQAGDADYRGRLLELLEDLAERGSVDAEAVHDSARFLVRKARDRVVIVSGDSILWTEARKDYVRLHTGGDDHLIRDTMANVERRLDPDRFVRVHRSAIVRIDAIVEFRTPGDGRLEVVLSDGSQHAVSASGRRLLEEKLGIDL
jgi:two-component system LytT family response regulator